MLDDLLAQGQALWRLIPGDRAAVAFDRPEEVDWEAEPAADFADGIRSETARRVVEYLNRRGASFAGSISAALGGAPVADALRELVALGAIRCDSYAPLRAHAESTSARGLDSSGRSASAKRRAQGRMQAQDAGRWELVRPPAQKDTRARISRAFDRWAILCRETALIEGIDWRNALTVLRVMEYSGEIRRGYFVEGLSGAQFTRKGDFTCITAMLSAEGDGCACLCAADPAQAWARILPLPPEISFLCVPGTVVVTQGGRIVLVLERQGTVLTDYAGSTEAYRAFAAAFRQSRVYRNARYLTVKQYPPSAVALLIEAGFVREMRDYVLWR